MPQLPKLSKEEQEKVQAARNIINIKPVTPETYFISKLAFFLGYEGVKAYLVKKELSHEDAQELVRGMEMVWHEYGYITALGAYYGSKDGKAFNKGSEYFKNRIKIDE